MTARSKRRRWPIHVGRLGVIVALVALFGALLYLNRVGLPDFLKRQLLEKLRARERRTPLTR